MASLAFDQPAWLLAALPLLALALWSLRGRRPQWSARRRHLVRSLRVTGVTALLLALAGANWLRATDRLTLILAVDRSHSVDAEATAQVEAFLRDAARERPDRARVGVVVFGEQAMVESSPSLDWTEGELLATPGRGATDLAAAVRLAQALFGPADQARLVLLSDGRETRGSVEAAVSGLSDDVAIDWLALPSAEGADAVIEGVRLPQRLQQGQPFAVHVTARASADGEATLRLYRDGRPVGSRRVRLQAGRPQIFSVEAVAPEVSGPLFYRAEIEMAGDSTPENNRGRAIASVEGRPRVLLVDSDPANTVALGRALTRANFDVERGGVSLLPAMALELSRYQTIVLGQVPATSLSGAQLQALRDYVHDAGGGLVMLGGPDTFGAGGYWDTPVEQALPLDMDVKDERHVPSAGLVLCIDKSGSMAGTAGVAKIDVAKAAALEVANKMTARDRVGVIAFDSAAKWVVPLTAAGPGSNVRAPLGELRAGGGTDAYPAMELAFETLVHEELRAKHVIVLTDGQIAGRDHAGLAQRMMGAGITVSTVGIGPDADVHTLETIARSGGGRTYRAVDAANVPRIFLREAFQITRSWLVEESFTPISRRGHPLLANLPLDDLPRLDGYVAATEKAAAQHLLGTHHDDPLLSVWQYGLGRSVAFTSDASGRWSASWLAWDGFEPFWSGLVRWASRQAEVDRRLQLTVERRGDGLQVAADAFRRDGSFLNAGHLDAVVLAPDGERRTVVLEQTAPGRYAAQVETTTPGAYVVSAFGDGPDPVGATAAEVVTYSSEFSPGIEPAGLEALVERGRVERRFDAEALFAAAPGGGERRVDLASWLLGLAAVAFLGEIAARKLRFDRPARAARVSAPPQRLSRLQTARARAGSGRPIAAPEALGGAAPAARPAATAARSEIAGQSLGQSTQSTAAEPTAAEPTAAEPTAARTASRLLASKRRRRS